MAEMKFGVTEEQLREAVKAIVREEMNRMVGVRDLIRDAVAEAVDRAVKEQVGDKFDAIAGAALDEHLSKPFKLTDGWGMRVKEYATYSEFITDKLREKFEKDDWEVKREFERRLQKKVNEAWNEYRENAIASVMAKAESMLEEE